GAPARGADDPGEDGRGLVEGVGWRAVVCWFALAPGKQPPDTGADGSEDLRHLLIGRWGRGVKGEVAGLRLAEDAVEHERVVMDVELKAAAEALDHGDRPDLAAGDPVGAGGARIVWTTVDANGGLAPKLQAVHGRRARACQLAVFDAW